MLHVQVWHKAEMKNLQSAIERMKSERDALVRDGQGVRDELEKSSSELSRIETEMARTESSMREAESLNTRSASEIASLEEEQAALTAEIGQLKTDTEKANVAKAAASQAKEDAIAKAIMFGTSAQATSAGPTGYAFAGLPPSASAMPPPQAAATRAPPMQQFAAAPAAPVARVPLESQPWYHGGIARPQCEALLLGPTCGPNSFCVRVSTRGDGAYSLSVREPMQLKVKHFKIERVGAQWKLSLKVPDNKIFPDIVALIAHYQSIGNFSGISLAVSAPNPNAPAAPPPAGAGAASASTPCCATPPTSTTDKFCGVCGVVNPLLVRSK